MIYAGSVKTSSADPDALRNYVVETFVSDVIYQHRPFDVVVRESFTSGRNKRATQTIFSAWAAADVALARYGYVADDSKPLSPTYIKRLLTGNGKAEKEDVAVVVRKLLRLGDDYKFAKGYDDSDAAAVCLAYLIREGVIKKDEKY